MFIVLPFFTFFVLQDGEILSFEYEASTRGLSKKVTIRKDSTFIFDQEKKIKLVTKKSDWIFLNQQISKLDLNKLDLFEAPTDERHTDRVLNASLIITTTNHSYESTEFDHGNSPEEIEPIVELLTRFLQSE